jgi:hypothetical protein
LIDCYLTATIAVTIATAVVASVVVTPTAIVMFVYYARAKGKASYYK